MQRSWLGARSISGSQDSRAALLGSARASSFAVRANGTFIYFWFRLIQFLHPANLNLLHQCIHICIVIHTGISFDEPSAGLVYYAGQSISVLYQSGSTSSFSLFLANSTNTVIGYAAPNNGSFTFPTSYYLPSLTTYRTLAVLNGNYFSSTFEIRRGSST